MTLGKKQALAEERTAAGRERLDLLKVFRLYFDVRYSSRSESLLSCQRGMCVSIRLAGLRPLPPCFRLGLDVFIRGVVWL